MLVSISSWFKSTLFYKTWLSIKGHQKTFWLTLLFDLLIIVSIYVGNKIFSFITPAIAQAVKGIQGIALGIGLVYLAVFLLSMLTLYSVFKFLILNEIIGAFQKHKTDYGLLRPFVYLNILLGITGFVVYFLINKISPSFTGSIQGAFAVFGVIIVISLLYYNIIHFSQLIFLKNRKVFESYKKGMSVPFSRFKQVFHVVLASILLLVIFNLIFYGVGQLVRLASASSYVSYVGLFNMANLIVIYLINAFNRFYIYFKVKNE